MSDITDQKVPSAEIKLIPGVVNNPKPIPHPIKMKPISYKKNPDPDICVICQENIEQGHRITMCKRCKIYLHYRCHVKWLFFYNSIYTRNCCHCKRSWEADYSTIQIVKNNSIENLTNLDILDIHQKEKLD